MELWHIIEFGDTEVETFWNSNFILNEGNYYYYYYY